MQLSFLQPVMAVLLLAIPLVWFLPTRPRPVHGAIRSLVLALAILALMQPVLVQNAVEEHHAIVLDQSASLAPGEGEAARATRKRPAEPARRRPRRHRGADRRRRALRGRRRPRVDKFGTGPCPGIALGRRVGAGRAFHTEGHGRLRHADFGRTHDRCALGRFPRPDAWSANIPVHTMQLVADDDPFLANLRTSRARPGESVRVGVDVVGAGAGLTVRLAAGDESLGSFGPFDCTARCPVAIEFEAKQPGFLDIVAELQAPAPTDDPANNRLAGVVAIEEPLKVLYVGERQQGAIDRLASLLGTGFDLTTAPPTAFADEIDFAGYEIVMLDDAPARSLAETGQRALTRAVQSDGVGLLASGGAAAFADGGFHGTPVADVLPIEITGEEEKVDPSVGLAIIIDTSGSMAGSRIELAKQIARIAVRRLQPHDRIGIVEFYGAKHWAVPMQPASNKIEIDRAIGRMKAIGGTVLYPAIQEAYYGLKNVNTRYKHILLITDAGVEDSNYERMVRRISKDNINVSSILVGQGGHNLIMSDIANWGQGRFYAVGNQFSLVELILKQPSTRKPPRYKRGTFEVDALGGRGWWGGAEPDVPALSGYAEVEPRSGAETLLTEAGTEDPILASWRYGLGRVTAFMTEPVGEGTAGWIDWPDYGSFLGRVLARTAADNPPFRLTLTRRHGSLALSAQRTGRDTAVVPTAELVDADGMALAEHPVTFRENAPGLFEAAIPFPAEVPARVVVTATDLDGDGRRQRVALPASSDKSNETQADPAAGLDLQRLAERTGGVHLASVHGTPPAGAVGDWLAGHRGELSYVVTRLWPLLLLLAIGAYLAELLYRRWPRGGAGG